MGHQNNAGERLRQSVGVPHLQPGFDSRRPRQHVQIAQSVERGSEKPCVGGSIPPLDTITGSAPGRCRSLQDWPEGIDTPALHQDPRAPATSLHPARRRVIIKR